MIEENKSVKQDPHNIILEDRKRLSISGVSDVLSFDENVVVLETLLGRLTIKGYNMHISRTIIETGELSMEGEICELLYSASSKKNDANFLSRMFR